jgi:NAD(P)-dependent dehydrogenase (short-subunit alcohol dehydrogenase family)
MKISECVLLVTGGSSGLGAAVAAMALEAGARVVVADLRPPTADHPNGSWAERLAYVATDVTDEASATAAVAFALERFGRLDVLVNAAGIAPGEKLKGKNGPHRLELFAKVLQVNLLGTFNMMRLAVPAFSKEPKEGCQGVIINTASIAAFDGQVGQVAYAASKGGIVAMTLPAARELSREGIRVVTIAPGVFHTPMFDGLPAPVQESIAQTVPFPQRLGRPDEYAALVRHVIENDYLNGEVIRLDGALRLAAK